MALATDHLAMKLVSFMSLNQAELACLAELQSAPIEVARGRELLHQGEQEHFAYVLQAGWGCCFKILQGGGRQIITFPVPGDCVGLRSVILRTSDHAFSALTDAVVSRVEVSRILGMLHEFPRLGAALLWATSRDEAITVEHLASVGRRTSMERTAHFFMELWDRLRLVGLASEHEFGCPLNQYELADALGLSAIHVNRVLRNLRQRKLMTFHAHMVTLHDIAGLKLLAGYEVIEAGAAVRLEP